MNLVSALFQHRNGSNDEKLVKDTTQMPTCKSILLLIRPASLSGDGVKFDPKEVLGRYLELMAERMIPLATFILQRVFIKSFCKGQLPRKFVNLSFIIVDIKNKLTDSCGN